MSAADRQRLAQLDALVRKRIEAGGGWLDFADYMQLALHEPGLGYYACGADVLGADGDFITAPQISELYCRCIGRFVAACLPPDGAVLELGPGSGRLAAGILAELAGQGRELPSYLLLETSARLAGLQRDTLAQAGLADCCSWPDGLPADFRGVVIANEVADALPCKVLVRHDDHWVYRGVAIDDDGGLSWSLGPPASSEDAARLAGLDVADGYLAEIGSQAEAWVETLARSVTRGAVLVIDYGFARRELYHPQRLSGTLCAHARHQVRGDVLAAPGSKDITYHVDFSALCQAGLAAGLTPAGFTTQASFLLDLGIAEMIRQDEDMDIRLAAQQSQQLQTLLMPQEMGDLFKVLALASADADAVPGFKLRNRIDDLLPGSQAG